MMGTKMIRFILDILYMSEMAAMVTIEAAIVIREFRKVKYKTIRNTVKTTHTVITPRNDFSLLPETERIKEMASSSSMTFPIRSIR